MSSLFGALTTAVSGLTSQSAAFSNISDNVANSTTVGYKATDTNFSDYLTTSSQVTNDSGFVTARPDYTNEVQGTISASTNTTALAISGNGFFQVTQASTDNTNTETLGTQAEYTRDGNFSLDKNGYLVNDAGEALNGWILKSNTVPRHRLDRCTSNQSYDRCARNQNNFGDRPVGGRSRSKLARRRSRRLRPRP